MTCTETKASFSRSDIDFDKLKLPFFNLRLSLYYEMK